MTLFIFFFKQKTAYEMRISDWSSDVCSSDLEREDSDPHRHQGHLHPHRLQGVRVESAGFAPSIAISPPSPSGSTRGSIAPFARVRAGGEMDCRDKPGNDSGRRRDAVASSPPVPLGSSPTTVTHPYRPPRGDRNSVG